MNKSNGELTVESNKEPEIKAPFANLNEWRIVMVPKVVWEDRYLQAFLKMKALQIRISLVVFTSLGLIIGYHAGVGW